MEFDYDDFAVCTICSLSEKFYKDEDFKYCPEIPKPKTTLDCDGVVQEYRNQFFEDLRVRMSKDPEYKAEDVDCVVGRAQNKLSFDLQKRLTVIATRSSSFRYSPNLIRDMMFYSVARARSECIREPPQSFDPPPMPRPFGIEMPLEPITLKEFIELVYKDKIAWKKFMEYTKKSIAKNEDLFRQVLEEADKKP